MSHCFQGAAIAFDLDGTLVDTAPDLVRALNAVIAPDGLQPVGDHEVRAMVGRGARALIERAYASREIDLDAARIDQLVAHFIEVYHAGIADLSRPFDGCVATLESLREQGARLSVCTNKPSFLADALLAELNLESYFERVIGPDRTTAKKPDAAHFFSAITDGGPNVAMIGDSKPDVACARAAKAPVIVMSYGYTETPAHTLGADRVLDDFSEIPAALKALWASSD